VEGRGLGLSPVGLKGTMGVQSEEAGTAELVADGGFKVGLHKNSSKEKCNGGMYRSLPRDVLECKEVR